MMATKPGGAIQGRFPSLKLQRSVPYTSTLERDLLFVLEYESRILHYQEQPFAVTGVVEGREHHYTPDYALWTDCGQTLIECKPAALLSDPHTRQQLAVGNQWAPAHGWQFEVVTDTSLRTGCYLANLKLLWRYSRLLVSHTLQAELLERTLTAKRLPLAVLASAPEAIPAVLHLIFRHVLQVDLSQPLNAQSLVWR